MCIDMICIFLCLHMNGGRGKTILSIICLGECLWDMFVNSLQKASLDPDFHCRSFQDIAVRLRLPTPCLFAPNEHADGHLLVPLYRLSTVSMRSASRAKEGLGYARLNESFSHLSPLHLHVEPRV